MTKQKFKIIRNEDKCAELLAGKEVSMEALSLYFALKNSNHVAIIKDPWEELVDLGLIIPVGNEED